MILDDPDQPWTWHYILDADGNPQRCEDFYAWAEWFETADRNVCQDMDEGAGAERVRVSTVFLGIDHGFGGGLPLLYETLVFGGLLDGEMYRYANRDLAVIGHQVMCARVKAAIKEGN